MIDRKARFKRLAEARTNKAIKLFRLIGNLSNRSNYQFSEKEVNKIFTTLEAELKATKQRFKTSIRQGEEVEFNITN